MPRKKALATKKSTAYLSNILNEMFFDKIMTLQELRFFLTYLSKIDPKNPEATEISFTLDDYSHILGVELNEKNISQTVDHLLSRVVTVEPTEFDEDVLEERIKTPLFKRCRMIRRKSDNKWYLTFECSDDVKPHIFSLTSKFTAIEVWNIINLTNVQDARMYMLLKQYRKIGERTIDLEDLKQMLGIDPSAYPKYPIFARDVLKKCQAALKQRTDICFDFNAVGRPATAVHFTIHGNEDYTLPAFLAAPVREEPAQIAGQLSVDDYVAIDRTADREEEEEDLPMPYNALKGLNLTKADQDLLVAQAYLFTPDDQALNRHGRDNAVYEYLYLKVKLMHAYASKNPVASQFSFLKSAVEQDWK